MILMHKPSDVPTLLLTPPWILVTPEQENICTQRDIGDFKIRDPLVKTEHACRTKEITSSVKIE
jgi:hypothetical protein